MKQNYRRERPFKNIIQILFFIQIMKFLKTTREKQALLSCSNLNYYYL